MAVEKLTFEMNAVGNAVPEMKKVQAQLGTLDKTMNKSTANMNRHVRGMHNVARANKGMTRNLGMASLQFQDMAVQASMGTDALRIMTMQGPQLASIFGPKGMIVGALIAVGGAMAMLGERTHKTTFEFKKFAKDIGVLEPLTAAFNKVKEVGTNVLNFIKTMVIGAVNGIINGTRRAFIIFRFLPRIVGEAVQKAIAHIKLFGLQVALVTNDIKFKFQMMFDSMVREAVYGARDLVAILNQVGAGLDPNIGQGLLDSMENALDKTNIKMVELIEKMEVLEGVIDGPITSMTDLRLALEAMDDIDIAEYFKRMKIAGEDAADSIGQKVQSVAGFMSEKFGDAFMSFVDGSKKGKDAFRTMASDIIRELYRIFVVKRITGFISSALTSAFPILGTPMKAIGGPVQRGNPYVVGERGPELFVPSRTGSIVPNDKMTSGGAVVVNQTINVSTGVQQTVRTEIKSLMPQIAESAKSAVADAKRRGGSYGRAFA